jgi:hypothetical protein
MYKIKNFIELFRYWCGKLNLPYFIIIKDNRYNCYVALIETENGNYIIYNEQLLNNTTYFDRLRIVFHEIGHIINKGKYVTKEEKIEEEYKAERFALYMIKKNYPFYFDKIVERAKNINKKLDNKIFINHIEAFSKIKEYN